MPPDSTAVLTAASDDLQLLATGLPAGMSRDARELIRRILRHEPVVRALGAAAALATVVPYNEGDLLIMGLMSQHFRPLHEDVHLLYEGASNNPLRNACAQHEEDSWDRISEAAKGDAAAQADMAWWRSLVSKSWIYGRYELVRKMYAALLEAEEASKPPALRWSEDERERASQDLQAARAEFDSLTGLATVKEQVATFTNVLAIQRARAAQGLPAPPMSYHLVFLGPPGTRQDHRREIGGPNLRRAGASSQRPRH